MSKILILNSLGLDFDINQANQEGWLTIKAPHRKDVNPSFAINVKHGGWKDNATGESGDIYELVKLVHGCNFAEAKQFVDGKGISKVTPKTKEYYSKLDSPFWTRQRLEWLKCAQEKLITSNSDLITVIKQYDLISRETLQHFDCGIIEYNFGNGFQDALLIPYPTGAQIYARNEEGKLIRMEKGSKPGESFMGAGQLKKNKRLIITKSPREVMLAFQELGDEFDVLGICSGETSKLSNPQKQLLHDKQVYWNRVFVSFDRDTVPAEEIAFEYARAVCDEVGTFKRDIRLLNIPKLSGNNCKDLTDLFKSSHSKSLDRLFDEGSYEYSEYIWNSWTENYRFWEVDDKGKLAINEVRFARVLGKFGYKKSYFGNADVPTLVQDEDNVLHEVSPHQLSDFVLDKILEKFSKYVDTALVDGKEALIPLNQLQKVFFKYRDKVLSSQIKAIFRNRELNIMNDTQHESFLYFKNGSVRVTKDGYELIQTKDLPGKIWESQIMERSFEEVAPHGAGDLEIFVEHVSGDTDTGKQSFMSVLGYLLHTHKNKANSPAIVLIDEKSSPNIAQGGTGKSLFAQSIKHIRKQRYLAGKNVDPSSRFFFMDVELGDQCLFFDDVRHDFDFEALFNIITDDMQVEAKYKNRFTISFDISPKIALATNSVIQGLGNSFKRRQFILPFSDFYLNNPTPESEFGRKLFDDWHIKEWQRYDHFMIRCLQLYLKEGLLRFPSQSYKLRAISVQTSPDFLDWAEVNLEEGVEYPLNVLFNGEDKIGQGFTRLQPEKADGTQFPCFADVSNDLMDSEIRSFRKWLDAFATFKGWKLHERHSNGYKVIRFAN
ncbi:MAG: hypothetical protein RLN83_07840 [Balneola sp.]|tara:strand:- start:20940 stop:23432 length:2493 start_codon:yes stop_codon:yes gene_type:complete